MKYEDMISACLSVCQVLLNPFDDIVPRETIKYEKTDSQKKKAKKKGKK